jgi:cellobiose phosphorylase
MIRAVEFLLSQVSPRGLSLLGPGDWNDDLDEAGVEGTGESVLTSMMLAWALAEAAAVATLRDDRTRARVWNAKSREVSRRVNTHAWDGEWYLRAINDRKDAIGSASGATPRIFLVPQLWAVISGVANAARSEAAMASVRSRLLGEFGLSTVDPPYPRPDRHIGTITRYRPGVRDNGGVSSILGAWAVMAECILGRGNAAYEMLKRFLPQSRQDRAGFDGEPYSHTEFLRGPASGEYGRADSAWAPGVASWYWRVMTDWIVGVRPDYPGLRIDPCVPADWKEFGMVRPFREAIYQIAVHNPGVEHGVRKVTVDGKNVRHGHAIPDFRDKGVHEVIVEMG